VVRSWQWGDVADLARQANSRAVSDQMLRFPHPYRRLHAMLHVAFVGVRRALGRETNFAIEAGGKLAGGIGLLFGSDQNARQAELYYWLGESFWGRGIATAAVRAFTEHVFRSLEVERIFALPFEDNRASGRVLEKAGFRREGSRRGSAIKRGVVHDQLVYGRSNARSSEHGGVEQG
jgi:RimJ/RimL family protein N-acetyltransferase